MKEMNRTAYQIKAYPLNVSESFNVIEKTIIWGEKRGDKSRIMISLIPNHEDALSEIHTILEKITII